MNDTPVQLGAAVLLKQEKSWNYGLLTNHVWSYAGTDSRQDVSSTFRQPFLSYTTKTYTTFGVNTESTYDWENSQWTVPINAQASQLLKLGSQPVQLGVGLILRPQCTVRLGNGTTFWAISMISMPCGSTAPR